MPRRQDARAWRLLPPRGQGSLRARSENRSAREIPEAGADRVRRKDETVASRGPLLAGVDAAGRGERRGGRALPPRGARLRQLRAEPRRRSGRECGRRGHYHVVRLQLGAADGDRRFARRKEHGGDAAEAEADGARDRRASRGARCTVSFSCCSIATVFFAPSKSTIAVGGAQLKPYDIIVSTSAALVATSPTRLSA